MDNYPTNLCLRDQLVTLIKQASPINVPVLHMDIPSYVEKVIANAEIVTWSERGLIGAFVAIYCNDLDSRIAFITMVTVDAHHQRRGLATILVRAALDIARSRAFRRCRLRVHEDNFAATKLYERMGFSSINKCENFTTMELVL